MLLKTYVMEVIVTCPEQYKEEAAGIIVRCMQGGAVGFQLVISCDVVFEKHWGEEG